MLSPRDLSGCPQLIHRQPQCKVMLERAIGGIAASEAERIIARRRDGDLLCADVTGSPEKDKEQNTQHQPRHPARARSAQGRQNRQYQESPKCNIPERQ